MFIVGKDKGIAMGQVIDLPRRRQKAPTTENGKVAPPRRRPNRAIRSREHLTPAEVEQLIAAAGAAGRHTGRDRTLVTLMYRHGLRVSEAVSLRWDQADLKAGLLHEILIGAFMVVTTPVTLMLLARAALYRDEREGNPDAPPRRPPLPKD